MVSINLIISSNQMKKKYSFKIKVIREHLLQDVVKCTGFCSFNSQSTQRALWWPISTRAQARAQTVSRRPISVQSSCSASTSQVCICSSGQMIRFSDNSRV